MKNVVFVVCLAVLLAVPAVQAGDNGPDISAQVDYQYTDTGWYTFSVTSDCADGWGDDTWELTLTAAKDLTVRVKDCCVTGDFYEIYVGDCVIGTTPEVEIGGGVLSDGSFTVTLQPGVYLIKVRLALEDFDILTGCPAGFEVWGSLADPTDLDPPCTVDVQVDIKPGSCPNPFNGKSKGSVPVAIVGTADLDVTTIDPTSLQLNGVPIVEDNILIADVTQPGDYDPADCYDCFEGGPVDTDGDGIPDYVDGYLDLVVKFDTQELADAIGAVARDDCVELELTGVTYDGLTVVVGSDSVVIRTK